MTKGENIPDFELQDQKGEVVSGKDFRGKWLVLYFYPRDNTSGCTREAKDFSSLLEEFRKNNCMILGVSPDTVDSHANFAKKHDLSITLLSDPERDLIRAAGAWGVKRNYGREYQGVIRSTLLIDPLGKVAHVWKGVKVRRKTKACEILHASEVLCKLQELEAEG